MSFASALDQLHALGAELAAPNAPRRKFDLAHMRTLVRALGDPQLRFPSVLIAGTNGKGSTAATLAHILAAAGVRTALYTSPHLVRVTERIRTNTFPDASDHLRPGAFADVSLPPEPESRTSSTPAATLHEIPEAAFARLFFQVDETARHLVAAGELPHPPSYFETLTALAFLHFAEQQVELAVLEVGLGGRLDATNVVEPLVCVITDIALDHQDYLGPTIRDIAREKAGILRAGGTLITLPQHPEANQAIGEAAVALDVRAINAADYLPGRNFTPPHDQISARRQPEPQPDPSPGDESPTAPLPRNHYTVYLDNQPLHIASALPGEHQQRNLALVIAAAHELRTRHGFALPNSAIEAGIRDTRWPGRLEFLAPDLLLDVAHNPAGAWTLRAAIATLPEDQPRTLVFSCLRDKDLREMAQILFPLFDSPTPAPGKQPSPPRHHIILTPIDNPRTATLAQLTAVAEALDIPARTAPTPAEALALARSLTPRHGLIIATGSIYLIGAIRALTIAP